jgi:hypothetical protein
MKFSTWLEEKTKRSVPLRQGSSAKLTNGSQSFAGALGPECKKCGEKMKWVPEPKFKKIWWGKKPGDEPKWLNKGHWQCGKCLINKVPELDAAAKKKLNARRRAFKKAL